MLKTIKRSIFLLSALSIFSGCSGMRELPLDNDVIEFSGRWNNQQTKSDDGLSDSLTCVRALQTDELCLLFSMIEKRDSTYVLSLTKEESDTLGISSKNYEKAIRYLDMLNSVEGGGQL